MVYLRYISDMDKDTGMVDITMECNEEGLRQAVSRMHIIKVLETKPMVVLHYDNATVDFEKTQIYKDYRYHVRVTILRSDISKWFEHYVQSYDTMDQFEKELVYTYMHNQPIRISEEAKKCDQCRNTSRYIHRRYKNSKREVFLND